MRLKRQWFVPVAKKKVWDTLTYFNKIAQLAFLTDDFIASDKNIKQGTSFSETHYFLGRRKYTGIFTKFKEPHAWELESYPKQGTGFPVYHKVLYFLTNFHHGTKVTCIIDYETKWFLGKYIDYILLSLVYLFVLDIHRKMKQECMKK